MRCFVRYLVRYLVRYFVPLALLPVGQVPFAEKRPGSTV